MSFEDQYLLLVRRCQVRCKQTTDRYRTTDMNVIVNNELIPENFDISVLISVGSDFLKFICVALLVVLIESIKIVYVITEKCMNETDHGAYEGIQSYSKCNSIIYIKRHTKKRECCLANNQVN